MVTGKLPVSQYKESKEFSSVEVRLIAGNKGRFFSVFGISVDSMSLISRSALTRASNSSALAFFTSPLINALDFVDVMSSIRFVSLKYALY